ncbi:MAG: Gfo/Idh/MocA family oxidoreductase [Candidatus Woesearchaeota archaeon]
MNLIKGIGIIGCGQRMIDNLTQLFKINPCINIIGVYDPNPGSISRLKEFLKKDVIVYDDYQSLIKNPDIEWILIGSINKAHKEQLIAALDNNKNIFSEKPLVITIDECMEVKKHLKPNLNCLISYPLRHSPHYKKIKELIDRGEIGDIISMEFNETIPFNHGSFMKTDWRRFKENSGGFIVEKCCHDMDLANWIIKSLPKKVASFGGANFYIEKNSNIYEDYTKQKELKFIGNKIPNPFIIEKDVIDNQVVIIEYYNGVRAVFHTNSNSSFPERRMYICGSKGTIRADLIKGKIELQDIFSENEKQVIDTKTFDSHGNGDEFLMKNLNKVILNEKHINDFDDALKSALTVIMIEQARTKNEIVDLTQVWKELGFLK